MADEQNGLTKSSSNAEMSPQEDGTKDPLTADSSGANAEVKFTSAASPNGDVKVEVGNIPTFSGLTKEELMKYNDDPFWIKLRWFLFIFFWAAWSFMLAAAIVIIILAPRCVPPPELSWTQESPMLDASILEEPEEFLSLMDSLAISNAYIPDLINPKDFDEMKPFPDLAKYEQLLEMAGTKDKKILTDFIQDYVNVDHEWANNASYADYFENDVDHRLNYNSTSLIDELKLLFGRWSDKGVLGFIMEDSGDEAKANAKEMINEYLETEKGGAIVSGIVEVDSIMADFAEPNMFKQFLQDHIANETWNYYKYNPGNSVGVRRLTENHIPLLSMGIFLIPGTPIYTLNPTIDNNINNTKVLIESLSKLRSEKAIQFGSTAFVNGSSDSIVTFVRTEKGVPGYAVALNLDNNEETVDLTAVKSIPTKGKLKMNFLDGVAYNYKTNPEEVLNSVTLAPFEGKVIQFVLKN